MTGLLYLAHLVVTKNAINRRRRRFSFLMRSWRDSPSPQFSYMDAKFGYEKAKQDMKAMTKHMRQVRMDIGASTTWDWSGNICAIRTQDHKFYAKDIKDLADSYTFEQAIRNK